MALSPSSPPLLSSSLRLDKSPLSSSQLLPLRRPLLFQEEEPEADPEAKMWFDAAAPSSLVSPPLPSARALTPPRAPRKAATAAHRRVSLSKLPSDPGPRCDISSSWLADYDWASVQASAGEASAEDPWAPRGQLHCQIRPSGTVGFVDRLLRSQPQSHVEVAVGLQHLMDSWGELAPRQRDQQAPDALHLRSG